MREIKFRAWSKKEKKMYVGVGIDSNLTFPRSIKGGGIDCLKLVTFKDIILEQYTGLKDKNSVEIYEGDILRDIYHGQKEQAKGQIIYQRFEFVIKKSPKHKTWWTLTCLAEGNIDNLEVIGNIHETKVEA